MNDDKPQSPPRHWHGPVGNRYEHHNVWVVGGPASSYMASRPSTSTTDAFATSERRVSQNTFYYRSETRLFVEYN